MGLTSITFEISTSTSNPCNLKPFSVTFHAFGWKCIFLLLFICRNTWTHIAKDVWKAPCRSFLFDVCLSEVTCEMFLWKCSYSHFWNFVNFCLVSFQWFYYNNIKKYQVKSHVLNMCNNYFFIFLAIFCHSYVYFNFKHKPYSAIWYFVFKSEFKKTELVRAIQWHFNTQ